MPIIVFQHSERGRPGRLGATLRDHGFALDIRRLDLGDPVPADYDGVDAVISLGGPQSVATGVERPEWLTREIEYVRGAHERGLPVVGVCLGHQIVAVALGGEVSRMPKPEVGFVPMTLKPAAHTETIFAGIPWTSHQCSHHEDAVTKAPPGAMVLASSPACDNQAMKAGMRTYSFQHHFEVDRELAMGMVRSSPETLAAAGITEAEFSRQMEEHYERFARLGDRLCLNIVSYLIPAPGLREMVDVARSGA